MASISITKSLSSNLFLASKFPPVSRKYLIRHWIQYNFSQGVQPRNSGGFWRGCFKQDQDNLSLGSHSHVQQKAGGGTVQRCMAAKSLPPSFAHRKLLSPIRGPAGPKDHDRFLSFGGGSPQPGPPPPPPSGFIFKRKRLLKSLKVSVQWKSRCSQSGSSRTLAHFSGFFFSFPFFYIYIYL